LQALESLYDSASLRARIGANAHAFMKPAPGQALPRRCAKVVLG